MSRNGVLAIYSVYYDDDGVVENWSEQPATLSGSSIDDLQGTIERFAEAFKKPVLDHDRHPIIEALFAQVHGDDVDDARAAVLRAATHPEATVRGIAVLCVGHLARLHRVFDAELRAVLIAGFRDDDEWVREHASSARDDVEQYFGVRLEPWDR